MANHVWQRVNINSEKKEVHNKLEEWFGNLDYSDVRGTVEPVFGKDWKYDIDKVGSKWVIVEDCYFDEDSSYINFCSAWNPADGFLEELMKVVLGIDEEATMDFTGDEESDDFLFAGYGSKRGFHCMMDDDNPETEEAILYLILEVAEIFISLSRIFFVSFSILSSSLV